MINLKYFYFTQIRVLSFALHHYDLTGLRV